MPTLQAPSSDATTVVGRPLPRTNDRDRRRASITAPRLSPGRYLAIEDGDEVVVMPIGSDNLRIGRSVAADVMIEHMSVSRRHAVVTHRGDDVVILDDRSLNGVLVNGERVREAVLEHGDEIRLGDAAITYMHVP